MQEVDSIQHSIGYYLANICWSTLLAHPAGYCKDTFSNNSGNKIKNKALLVSHDRRDMSSNLALGWGGTGPGLYDYALFA
eukprot:11409517-Ditylum_brightwellii.AAC.1